MAVGFENDHFRSFIKSHLFGTSQLLASVGGFLSLIGGISVISLFEIFYFLGCKNFEKNNKPKIQNIEASDDNLVKKSSLTTFLKKYCKISSIHGLNNVAEGKVFG